MILILLLGLCLIGVAVALGFRARVGDNVRGQQTLKHIGAYGFHAAARTGPLAPRERLNKFADTLGVIYSRYAREDRERQVLELLRSAGLYRMRPVTFLGYRVIVTMVSVIFWLWLLSVAGATPVAVFLLVVVFGAVGWLAPIFILKCPNSSTSSSQRLRPAWGSPPPFRSPPVASKDRLARSSGSRSANKTWA